ncbi:uncharacterized protein LOC126706390 isoform X3 [Quercus robur]|uniref:uncharacterized protein LOC126706390 isoform X3 n=1 Tax=Quercus robur TaxID=38942 RepID=UPI00216385B3|nr:uncharacterized protein LOC126706390 isoform X3 [Quercus robur]
MTTPYPSHLLSAPTFHASNKMALRIHSPPFQRFKQGSPQYVKEQNCSMSFRQFRAFQSTRPKVLCAINMSAGQSDDHGKFKLDHLLNKARKLWDNCPQSVKIFPWKKALGNFGQLILDLTLAVVKYLCVPLLAVSSLSEMSYCAHERKLFLVPVPLVIGITVAGVLRETALDISPHLKDHITHIGGEYLFHTLQMGVYGGHCGLHFCGIEDPKRRHCSRNL